MNHIYETLDTLHHFIYTWWKSFFFAMNQAQCSDTKKSCFTQIDNVNKSEKLTTWEIYLNIQKEFGSSQFSSHFAIWFSFFFEFSRLTRTIVQSTLKETLINVINAFRPNRFKVFVFDVSRYLFQLFFFSSVSHQMWFFFCDLHFHDVWWCEWGESCCTRNLCNDTKSLSNMKFWAQHNHTNFQLNPLLNSEFFINSNMPPQNSVQSPLAFIDRKLFTYSLSVSAKSHSTLDTWKNFRISISIFFFNVLSLTLLAGHKLLPHPNLTILNVYHTLSIVHQNPFESCKSLHFQSAQRWFFLCHPTKKTSNQFFLHHIFLFAILIALGFYLIKFSSIASSEHYSTWSG